MIVLKNWNLATIQWPFKSNEPNPKSLVFGDFFRKFSKKNLCGGHNPNFIFIFLVKFSPKKCLKTCVSPPWITINPTRFGNAIYFKIIRFFNKSTICHVYHHDTFEKMKLCISKSNFNHSQLHVFLMSKIMARIEDYGMQ